MEQIPGIPGSVPSLTAYPTREIQSSLPPEEWQACLDTWIFCLEFRLRLTPEHFSFFRLDRDVGGVPFLLSYFRNLDLQKKHEKNHLQKDDRGFRLHQLCFSLLRRLLLTTRLPLDLGPTELFELLSTASIVYWNSSTWRDSLKQVWKRSHGQVAAAVEACKSTLLQQLTAASPLDLKHAIALTRALPECGLVFMTGSDYLESMITGYTTIQETTTEHTFLCLRSLLSNESPNQSLLLDHLYTLKSSADKSSSSHPNQSTLLSSLLVSTTFLRHFDTHLAKQPHARGVKLLESLRNYREQTLHLHPPPIASRHKANKGKGKAASNEEMHMHQASQVSQIHELFPDLSNHYILKLLDHFSDNVEAVTAALLEPDSLPQNLVNQPDRNPKLESPQKIPPPPPKQTPSFVPQRKNVFDNDDFSNHHISTGRLHQGRRDIHNTAHPTPAEHARSKAAILSALSAFDADDDERDDSYDVADVGGAVDTTLDTDTRTDTNEELLYRAWREQPVLFARDSKTRLSQPRQRLKHDTGMTDEQIEGWALVLSRDENMQNRLKQKYHAAARFTGNQSAVLSIRWQAGQSDSEGSGSDGQRGGSRMGQAQIRGARRFGGGRGGGNTAGSADNNANVQAARKNKEQGRGGAAHNRREGRAKKMGRGMAGPANA